MRAVHICEIRDRASLAFAVVSVAAGHELDRGVVGGCRIALGGPRPVAGAPGPGGAPATEASFAVATEAFFEQPVELMSRHTGLYELLREYFLQDTRRWFAGSAVIGAKPG